MPYEREAHRRTMSAEQRGLLCVELLLAERATLTERGESLEPLQPGLLGGRCAGGRGLRATAGPPRSDRLANADSSERGVRELLGRLPPQCLDPEDHEDCDQQQCERPLEDVS